MSIQIDIPQEYLNRSIEATIASLKRSLTKQPNQLIRDIILQDIATYSKALSTMQVKK